MFGKSIISENNFTSSDLLHYIESLLSESRFQQRRSSVKTNYGWLKSRNLMDEVHEIDLEQFNSKILKLTSESYAVIAVKLEKLTDESTMLPSDIISAFSKLLDEEENVQLLKVVKERGKISKTNVMSEKRRGSLSFIFK